MAHREKVQKAKREIKPEVARIKVALPSEVYTALKHRAVDAGKTMSDICLGLIRAYLGMT